MRLAPFTDLYSAEVREPSPTPNPTAKTTTHDTATTATNKATRQYLFRQVNLGFEEL